MTEIDSQIDESPEASAEEPREARYVIACGGYWALLPCDAGLEIVAARQHFPVPHAPAWCLGLTSVRGELLPIVSLRQLLGEDCDEAPRWLLVVRPSAWPTLAIGLAQLPEKILLDEDIQPEERPGELPFFVTGVMAQAERRLVELDLDRLLEALQRTPPTTTETADDPMV